MDLEPVTQHHFKEILFPTIAFSLEYLGMPQQLDLRPIAFHELDAMSNQIGPDDRPVVLVSIMKSETIFHHVGSVSHFYSIPGRLCDTMVTAKSKNEDICDLPLLELGLHIVTSTVARQMTDRVAMIV